MDLSAIQKQCDADSQLYFPELRREGKDGFVYLALALGGEVGELQNVIKKWIRSDYAKHHLDEVRQELPDVFIYLCELATALRVDLEQAYHDKREFNNGRFIRPARDT